MDGVIRLCNVKQYTVVCLQGYLFYSWRMNVCCYRKKVTPPRLDVRTLDFSSSEHIKILSELGIVVESLGNGKVQVSHVMQKAKTPEDAEEGWYLMQDIMKLMSEQKKMQEEAG